MIFVLDANAMIALLYNELGADVVEDILKQQGATCYAHAINLCEVFYGVMRSNGMGKAQASLTGLKALGIQTRDDMDDSFWQDAGSIKAAHRLSLADAFAVALTRRVNGELVTSDHHELEPIAQAGVCKINFFR